MNQAFVVLVFTIEYLFSNSSLISLGSFEINPARVLIFGL
jgi:hypothetical protein